MNIGQLLGRYRADTLHGYSVVSSVAKGQVVRSQEAELTRSMIRAGALKPHERQAAIMSNLKGSSLGESDPTLAAMGVSVDPKMITVSM
jgi:hypothetical protein